MGSATDTAVDVLAGIAPEQVQGVLDLGTRVRLPAGQVLFSLGDPAQCLYLVERGRIALTLPMTIRDREQDVLIEERGPGQTLGWSALVPPHRFTLKAAAAVDAEVLALPRAALFAHFDAQPSVGYPAMRNLAAVVGQRLQVLQAMWLREVQRVVENTRP